MARTTKTIVVVHKYKCGCCVNIDDAKIIRRGGKRRYMCSEHFEFIDEYLLKCNDCPKEFWSKTMKTVCTDCAKFRYKKCKKVQRKRYRAKKKGARENKPKDIGPPRIKVDTECGAMCKYRDYCIMQMEKTKIGFNCRGCPRYEKIEMNVLAFMGSTDSRWVETREQYGTKARNA